MMIAQLYELFLLFSEINISLFPVWSFWSDEEREAAWARDSSVAIIQSFDFFLREHIFKRCGLQRNTADGR